MTKVKDILARVNSCPSQNTRVTEFFRSLLEFSVPVTRSPVRVGGVLRSHSGCRYGFEFVDLSPDQREVISKTCRTLALLQ